MMKDKALEELFLAARPTFDDGDAFIRKLEKRLDAVEYLKQHEEACIRRYRYAMLATFVLGLVLGGGAIAMMLNAPADQPLFTFGAESGMLLLLGQYSRFAAVILLSGLVCLTIVSIVNIVVDLLNMRDVNRDFQIEVQHSAVLLKP